MLEQRIAKAAEATQPKKNGSSVVNIPPLIQPRQSMVETSSQNTNELQQYNQTQEVPGVGPHGRNQLLDTQQSIVSLTPSQMQPIFDNQNRTSAAFGIDTTEQIKTRSGVTGEQTDTQREIMSIYIQDNQELNNIRYEKDNHAYEPNPPQPTISLNVPRNLPFRHRHTNSASAVVPHQIGSGMKSPDSLHEISNNKSYSKLSQNDYLSEAQSFAEQTRSFINANRANNTMKSKQNVSQSVAKKKKKVVGEKPKKGKHMFPSNKKSIQSQRVLHYPALNKHGNPGTKTSAFNTGVKHSRQYTENQLDREEMYDIYRSDHKLLTLNIKNFGAPKDDLIPEDYTIDNSRRQMASILNGGQMIDGNATERAFNPKQRENILSPPAIDATRSVQFSPDLRRDFVQQLHPDQNQKSEFPGSRKTRSPPASKVNFQLDNKRIKSPMSDHRQMMIYGKKDHIKVRNYMNIDSESQVSRGSSKYLGSSLLTQNLIKNKIPKYAQMQMSMNQSAMSGKLKQVYQKQALKEVILDQKKQIDYLEDKKKFHRNELQAREKLILSLQQENQDLLKDKVQLKDRMYGIEMKSYQAFTDVGDHATRVSDLETQLRQRSEFEHQIITKLEDVSKKYQSQNKIMRQLEEHDQELRHENEALLRDLTREKNTLSAQRCKYEQLLAKQIETMTNQREISEQKYLKMINEYKEELYKLKEFQKEVNHNVYNQYTYNQFTYSQMKEQQNQIQDNQRIQNVNKVLKSDLGSLERKLDCDTPQLSVIDDEKPISVKVHLAPKSINVLQSKKQQHVVSVSAQKPQKGYKEMLLGSHRKQKKVKYEVDPNEIQLAKPRYE